MIEARDHVGVRRGQHARHGQRKGHQRASLARGRKEKQQAVQALHARKGKEEQAWACVGLAVGPSATRPAMAWVVGLLLLAVELGQNLALEPNQK